LGSKHKWQGSDAAERVRINIVLKNLANEVGIPVYKSNKFGHRQTNIPFVFNVQYKLEKQADKFVLGVK
jgi:muramoyltetrapeptide carboxypeptidase LdcA involved in peptidoglycan recycling